ncbi:hypothetical protein J1771_gp87 [Gordonia phage MelBins]|uniref:Uncharacterized protein n=1 Tax=Gordonia phage MelBins TaxID=2656540 RepID=A0A649VN33_9CAUD|nr:hypothetical protein J1771_gp87 [Gordonia phage MelBins]QGJ93641.1 hypothetical protein SEA_MELBINS_87 [Gordonia phage MelBins]
MAGTVTRYQCDWCGAHVTWRNTPEGRRGFAESNRRHDFHLRPVGDEYHGRHRLEDGGACCELSWSGNGAGLWVCDGCGRTRPMDDIALAAFFDWAPRPQHLVVDVDAMADALTLDVRRYLSAQGIDTEVTVVFDRDALPEVYADASSLGTIPGAPYWIDGLLVFPYQRALPPGKNETPGRLTFHGVTVETRQTAVDLEFEAWLQSVTPPPYP